MSKYSKKVIPELCMDLPVYDTCYKGSIPYNVYINDEKQWISVYRIPKQSILDSDKCKEDDDTSLQWEKDLSSYHSNLLLKCYYTELFKGSDILNNYIGNSILIKTENGSYTYIGDRMYNFNIPSDDNILEFHSQIYDETSYPIAIGEQNIYFMLHGIYVDKGNIDLDYTDLKDAYYKFYYK